MIKLKSIRSGFLLGLAFVAVSCLNTDDCDEACYSPPAPFTLKIVDEIGNNLINNEIYSPDSINLFYVHENNNTDVKIYFDEVYDGYILSSGDLPKEMMETKNQTFFLYLNFSDTDTLTIEVVGKSDGCCTWHTYEKYQYNGAVMEIDLEYYSFVAVK